MNAITSQHSTEGHQNIIPGKVVCPKWTCLMWMPTHNRYVHSHFKSELSQLPRKFADPLKFKCSKCPRYAKQMDMFKLDPLI
jgi:hypothetical protein